MSSPSVNTFERDRSFNINSIESNASSMVGLFNWGAVNELIRITTNESELVRKLGRPNKDTTVYFHSAANYLLYSVPLYVVRAIDDLVAKNAVSNGTATLVKNDVDYETQVLDGIAFLAKCAGEYGNGLKISIADHEGFSDWQYKSRFDFAPEEGQFNVVVVDGEGVFSGSKGAVLEQYELLTATEGTKKQDGTSAFIGKVLKDQSQYLYLGDLTELTFTEGLYEATLTGGVDGNSTSADFGEAIATLSNSETLDIISSFGTTLPDNHKAALVDMCSTRQDSVAFLAPKLSDVYNNPTAADDVVDYFNTTINKNDSYGFYVDNWKLVYDKYADNTIWIPCDSDAAGIHARLFTQSEPWFSPAGLNRGQLRNVIKLAWNANKPQRDILYPAHINSIVSFEGEGTVLFGDKTALRRPSAFNRINVRSLFIVLKKSIARAARYQLFEINDPITQSIFRNSTDRYLDTVQGRRGIRRKLVVADETNNTPAVVDSNEFVGDIFIDPARSINNIRLNFVAIDGSVEFSELEGGSF